MRASGWESAQLSGICEDFRDLAVHGIDPYCESGVQVQELPGDPRSQLVDQVVEHGPVDTGLSLTGNDLIRGWHHDVGAGPGARRPR